MRLMYGLWFERLQGFSPPSPHATCEWLPLDLHFTRKPLAQSRIPGRPILRKSSFSSRRIGRAQDKSNGGGCLPHRHDTQTLKSKALPVVEAVFQMREVRPARIYEMVLHSVHDAAEEIARMFKREFRCSFIKKVFAFPQFVYAERGRG